MVTVHPGALFLWSLMCLFAGVYLVGYVAESLANRFNWRMGFTPRCLNNCGRETGGFYINKNDSAVPCAFCWDDETTRITERKDAEMAAKRPLECGRTGCHSEAMAGAGFVEGATPVGLCAECSKEVSELLKRSKVKMRPAGFGADG